MQGVHGHRSEASATSGQAGVPAPSDGLESIRTTGQPLRAAGAWPFLSLLMAVAVIGALEVHLRSTAPIGLLQLVPVMAAAARLGWRAALPLALLAGLLSALRRLVPPHFEPNRWPDACVVFGMLAAAAVVTSLWRQARQRERIARGTDVLTGLANRTAFEQRALAELNRSRRSGRPLTTAFVDCDEFKSVNDSRGHLAGDDVLRTMARVLRAGTRNYDVVARFGGDEFTLLLPETDADVARRVLGRLQAAVTQALAAHGVTVSIGAVTFLQAPLTVEDLLRAADGQLYLAKQAGRNTLRHLVLEAREGALRGRDDIG